MSFTSVPVIKNDIQKELFKGDDNVSDGPLWRLVPQPDSHVMNVSNPGDVEDALVTNNLPFRCTSCLNDVARQEGIVLRECFHHFCRPCLYKTVQLSEALPIVQCPYREGNELCHGRLMEIETNAIRKNGLISRNIFRCCTFGCMGWCALQQDQPEFFQCNVCKRFNYFSSSSVYEGGGFRMMKPEIANITCMKLHLYPVSNVPKKFLRCYTAGCNSLCSVLLNSDVFFCNACQYMNCILCGAMHEGRSCQQYQESVNNPQTPIKKSTEIKVENIDIEDEIFFCETPICSNYCVPKPHQKVFFCNICNCVTCIPCKARHENMTCEQYRFQKLRKRIHVLKKNLNEELTNNVNGRKRNRTEVEREYDIMRPLKMKRNEQASVHVRKIESDEIIQNEIKLQEEIIQREINRQREKDRKEHERRFQAEREHRQRIDQFRIYISKGKLDERIQEQMRKQEQIIQNKINMFREQEQTQQERDKKRKEVLTELLQRMEKNNEELIPNTEPFACQICFDDIATGDGVQLQYCLHKFCRTCLVSTIEHSETPAVKCPFIDGETACESHLFEVEIRLLLNPEQYEKRLQFSLNFAESCEPDSFHCKTPDCPGWIIVGNIERFNCEVCSRRNCIPCAAVHDGMTCQEYQAAHPPPDSDQQAKSKAHIDSLIRKGKAMLCPRCKIVINKIDGCDNVKCTMCQTEVCWATKGPRWGPKGKGDTSGGCRCNVDGKKCHPKCRNCH